MLAELLTVTMLALEEKVQDFLGTIYMRENFANKGTAQVFTPFHISECMAQMTFGDELEKQIQENDFITVSDPCCGSGVMTIGMSEALKSKGYNPQKVMWFQGTDIDITCCKMAYIQTSLLGLSGEIVYGNTLTLESWKRFITPMTLMNPKILNDIYFKKPEAKEEPKKELKQESEIISEIKPTFTIKQLSIFS
ncbi:N-6 DNA methylase [bacterium]|nr:N-6 DNA methylase [bacterium]